MYKYLVEKIGKSMASVLMGIWYFVLLFMVVFFLNYEAGVFNYLRY